MSAVKFGRKDDISEAELSSEIDSFKYFLASAASNFSSELYSPVKCV
jgi:hypothetical protein